MTIDFITKNDLLELKKEIISEVSNLLTGTVENKKWLKSADVRKMLSISPGTLQNLRVSRVLPFTKIGGTVFYDYNDVMKVMQKNKSEAV
ncbi:MAG: helix-turn-helix domain-containing protein [Chitinophagales bacterium]